MSESGAGDSGAAVPESSAAERESDDDDAERPRVAVACQGGGSLTAFTAGVLTGLFEAAEWDRFDLVGLSGTSGGAINALLAWYGLLDDGPAAATDNLAGFWEDVAATEPGDRLANDAAVWNSRVRATGLPTPEVSPYFNPFSAVGRERLRRAVERRVDFDRLDDLVSPASPRLVVGTVDINRGAFETFEDAGVTADAILASTAVPDTFEAVEMEGHWHWDGLFSQNPPVHDLMTVPASRKPGELWVLQINPQSREGEPRTVEEIADRRNELSGNLSLNQELRFIETVNDWIESGALSAEQYRPVDVRRIELGREMHCSTKVDRTPSFLRRLMDSGEAAAREFLDGRFGE